MFPSQAAANSMGEAIWKIIEEAKDGWVPGCVDVDALTKDTAAVLAKCDMTVTDVLYLTFSEVGQITTDESERLTLDILREGDRPDWKGSVLPLHLLTPGGGLSPDEASTAKRRRLTSGVVRGPQPDTVQQAKVAEERKIRTADALISVLLKHQEVSAHAREIQAAQEQDEEALTEWLDAFRDRSSGKVRHQLTQVGWLRLGPPSEVERPQRRSFTHPV